MAMRTRKDPERPENLGRRVRTLMRGAGQATLASALARDGSRRPYASLVLVAVDHDASPILLTSDLADHTANLKAEPRAALLFDGTAGYQDPLAGPRATVLGVVRKLEDGTLRARLKARFLARHPSAQIYADFKDFHLYRMDIESAHIVAGFGRVHWLGAGEVAFDAGACVALAEAERDMIDHMNRDHADALRLIASRIPGVIDHDWTMIGIDPEGFDLRCGRYLARAEFDIPVRDAETARVELVRLTQRARSSALDSTD